MSKTVVGLFPQSQDAQGAMRDLEGIGVGRGSALAVGTVEDGQADQAVAVFNRHNTIDITKLGSRYRESGHTGFDAAQPVYKEPDLTRERDLNEQITIPIIEEQLQVGKRAVERGGARVHTHVTERPFSEQVTLHEEHVTVNRHPVNRAVTDADGAFKEQTFQVTEMDEEVVVSKTARVVEEVVVGKTATDRTETISDTVRRTDVEVEDLDTSKTHR